MKISLMTNASTEIYFKINLKLKQYKNAHNALLYLTLITFTCLFKFAGYIY